MHPPSLLVLELRVKGVSATIADHVERKCSQHNRNTREDTQIRGITYVLTGFGEHSAPLGSRGLDAHADKAQSGRRQNGLRHRHGGLHNQRADGLGETAGGLPAKRVAAPHDGKALRGRAGLRQPATLVDGFGKQAADGEGLLFQLVILAGQLGGDIAADLVVVLPLADLVFVGAQDGALDNVAFALQLSIASFPLDAGLYALVRVGFGVALAVIIALALVRVGFRVAVTAARSLALVRVGGGIAFPIALAIPLKQGFCPRSERIICCLYGAQATPIT